VDNSGEFLASMKVGFIIFSILSLIGTIASLVRSRRPADPANMVPQVAADAK
jgi:hypothetical protein